MKPYEHFKFHFKLFAELILLPTRMLTSSGSLMVSRLIEFLFRKLKAFHYFQWLKCNALSTEQLIMRLFTTRANMWLYVDEYLITHMHVCVCVFVRVHVWATACPLVQLHLSTRISHSVWCSRCICCCYCAASTLPAALAKYLTNTHRRRGWPLSDAVRNSRTAPPVLELIIQ